MASHTGTSTPNFIPSRWGVQGEMHQAPVASTSKKPDFRTFGAKNSFLVLAILAPRFISHLCDYPKAFLQKSKHRQKHRFFDGLGLKFITGRPTRKSPLKLKKSSERGFPNNFRWVPDSCHMKETKSSRELFKKVRANVFFFHFVFFCGLLGLKRYILAFLRAQILVCGVVGVGDPKTAVSLQFWAYLTPMENASLAAPRTKKTENEPKTQNLLSRGSFSEH